MTLAQIEIKDHVSGAPSNWSVLVDGVEFADRISPEGLTLRIEPFSVPRIEVQLQGLLEARFSGVVAVSDRDVETLIALGWTPPAVTE